MLTAAVTIKIANQKTQKSYTISWLNYFICFPIYFYCKRHVNCIHDSPLPSENYFPLTEGSRRNSSRDNNRSRDFDVLGNCYCCCIRNMNLIHRYLPILRILRRRRPTYLFRLGRSRLRFLVDNSRPSFVDNMD